MAWRLRRAQPVGVQASDGQPGVHDAQLLRLRYRRRRSASRRSPAIRKCSRASSTNTKSSTCSASGTRCRNMAGRRRSSRSTARTFADVATEHGLSEINYLSIDTEGGELEILRSIDFRKFFVHAMSVEYRVPQREMMMALMREQNFEMIKRWGAISCSSTARARSIPPMTGCGTTDAAAIGRAAQFREQGPDPGGWIGRGKCVLQ